MSSPTGSSQWLANPGGDFYNGVITSSLRFNEVSNSRLDSPSFAGDGGDTWSWSAWVKLCDQGTRQCLFGRAGNNAGFFFNDTVNTNQFQFNDDGAAVCTSPPKRRDPSAWYHVTINGNGSINKLWVNGVQQTFDSNPNLGKINEAAVHYIGMGISTTYSYDGLIADVNFVDGTALDYTAFAEFNNGVLIPKEPSVTYGTNGFRLQFKGTGTSANSSGIGADTSGNDSHFTVVNLNAHDVLPDNPENNFATWNPLYRMYGDTRAATLTEGNLDSTAAGGNDREYNMSTIAVTEFLKSSSSGDGVYMEVRLPTVSGADNGYIGLLSQSRSDSRPDGATSRSDNSGHSHYHLISPNGKTLLEAGESSSSALDGLDGAQTDEAVIGWAVKNDGKFFISIDGTFSTNADGAAQNPVTGANPMGTIDITIPFFFHCGNIGQFQANFGQDSTFAGNETATSNADANGIGAFHTAPPTGYLAMCTSNMPEPPIGPNSGAGESPTDYFETIIYEGNGSTQNIAVDFKPDWTWIKNRDTTDAHQVFDSNRGATNALSPNTTAADAANDDTLTGFISTGFSLGDDDIVNTDDEKYVSWNWKSNGGTATATISENGNNPAASVQANAKAGFSIITYTGTGGNGTIAHGLGAVPKLMIFKNRTNGTTDDWMVYHGENSAYTSSANQTISPEDEHLHLNNTLLSANIAENFNDTAPTSSVLTVGTTHNVNADGETYVAYVFAEIDGYSKFGSFIGIQESDGTFAYTGFSPAFVICKLTNGGTTAHWAIFDNKRETVNVNDNVLFINAGAENSAVNDRSVDFLSNGFKVRSNAFRINGDADTVVYIAFSEMPFKYANAK